MDTNKNEDFEDFFKEILGTKVSVNKIDEYTEDEKTFMNIIENMEDSAYAEGMASIHAGIDLTKITNPLWHLIEQFSGLIFGQEGLNAIMWWLYSRYDENGELVSYLDEEGEEIEIKDTLDLYNYIKSISE